MWLQTAVKKSGWKRLKKFTPTQSAFDIVLYWSLAQQTSFKVWAVALAAWQRLDC